MARAILFAALYLSESWSSGWAYTSLAWRPLAVLIDILADPFLNVIIDIMSVEANIRSKLQQHFSPTHLEVHNESHMHSVPANSETHFKLVVVANSFEGLRAIARHQQIYKLLAAELAGPIHALAIHTYTPEEWQQQESAPDSPNCMGRS